MNKHILVVMAHQDDEAAFSTRIAREINQGNVITCVYLTDGVGNGIAPAIRDNESSRVLTSLGVKTDNIHFLGSQHEIPDGKLVEHLAQAYQLMEATLAGKKFHRIYCMAYEGGHHDHDACHLATIIYSTRQHLLNRTWQMPLYNGYKTRSKFFRVLSPVPQVARMLIRKLRIGEAIKHTFLVTGYTSQWKTWLGLFPELFYQRLLKRRETLLAVQGISILERPHEGPLLYERLFGYPYQTFRESAEQFLRDYGETPFSITARDQ